jgi:sugar lactone lactonase YvrE
LKLAYGEAEIVYTLEEDPMYIQEPEGIAIDWMGNIYISNRNNDGSARVKNEIIRITPWGDSWVVADLGPAAPGTYGVLGLTTDWCGNVYAAFSSGRAENHGVWKIRPYGGMERLNGSENINVPNALTFDARGNLYVTDSFPKVETDPGLVWKYGKRSREFEVWAESLLLAPDPFFNPFPFPGPGANGIAYARNHIYVANNEKSLILDIPVKRNGRAGDITIIAGSYPPAGPPGLLFAPDGLTIDVKGNLYSVVPAAGLAPFPLSPVIKIYRDTGEVEPIIEPITGPSPLFDFPTSLAFGRGFRDGKSLFVVNPTSGAPGGSGPAVTQVGVGVRGRLGQ